MDASGNFISTKGTRESFFSEEGGEGKKKKGTFFHLEHSNRNRLPLPLSTLQEYISTSFANIYYTLSAGMSAVIIRKSSLRSLTLGSRLSKKHFLPLSGQ